MSIQPKLKNKQRRIGLTGGIASGKSTIASYIKKYKDIPILDADQYSKELIKPKSNSYKKVLAYFGTQIVDEHSSGNEINISLLKKNYFRKFYTKNMDSKSSSSINKRKNDRKM
jgi:dephospho-CoA kinase